jgi:hypothetical protein
MVYKSAPVALRQPMKLVNGYYIGMTEERALVKVAADRWHTVMKEQELAVRRAWATNTNEKRRLDRGPVHLIPYDVHGQLMPHLASEEVTEADTPDFLIQEHMQRIRQPEWWVNRPDNLDAGKWAKLP